MIAVDKFKGSLTAGEAAEAIRAGLPEGAEADMCPIADGGEGFAETMREALGGRWVEMESLDPLGRAISARYVMADGVAVMEMAESSGFQRVRAEERDPLRSDTRGTGLMLRHAAMVSGAERILIGIGGSATNDGGSGMAAALGVRFVDGDGEELEVFPRDLQHLRRIDGGRRVSLPPLEVACDVDNPLFGDRGATAVYGLQKGVREGSRFEAMLARLVEVAGAAEVADLPGAGAAGGLGFGLVYFAGGKLRGGFEIVADAVGLAERVAAADVVITGEGSLDAQSLCGKGPAGIAAMARKAGKRVVALAGRITPEVIEAGNFDGHGALTDAGLPLEELMALAGELLEAKAREVLVWR